jgi:DNA repair exonuclease SbcCD ATPase subunit
VAAFFHFDQPLEGRSVMSETTETQTEQQAPVDEAAEPAEQVEEQPAEVEEQESGEPESDAQEAPADTRDEAFDAKQAAAKIRKANSEAQSLRKRLKEAEPLLKELQQIKDSQKSENERLTDQLAAANDRSTALRQRLVKAEVTARSGGFADPEDALGALDLDSYIDSDGEIDTSAIEADLQALLERKPHWAKSQPQEGPRRPAPDRTQASGANQSRTPPDPAEQFAGWIKTRLHKEP